MGKTYNLNTNFKNQGSLPEQITDLQAKFTALFQELMLNIRLEERQEEMVAPMGHNCRITLLLHP